MLTVAGNRHLCFGCICDWLESDSPPIHPDKEENLIDGECTQLDVQEELLCYTGVRIKIRTFTPNLFSKVASLL